MLALRGQRFSRRPRFRLYVSVYALFESTENVGHPFGQRTTLRTEWMRLLLVHVERCTWRLHAPAPFSVKKGISGSSYCLRLSHPLRISHGARG